MLTVWLVSKILACYWYSTGTGTVYSTGTGMVGSEARAAAAA
jgi:hypothetical protein